MILTAKFFKKSKFFFRLSFPWLGSAEFFNLNPPHFPRDPQSDPPVFVDTDDLPPVAVANRPEFSPYFQLIYIHVAILYNLGLDTGRGRSPECHRVLLSEGGQDLSSILAPFFSGYFLLLFILLFPWGWVVSLPGRPPFFFAPPSQEKFNAYNVSN